MNTIKQILLFPFKAIFWILNLIFGSFFGQGKESTKTRWSVLFIFIAGFLGAFFVYPQLFDKGIDKVNSKLGLDFPHYYNKPFKLGLDLSGGSQLIYKADFTNIPNKEQRSSLDGVRDVIEKRVNSFGISEPKVQISGEDRLIVELPGVNDISEAIERIGDTPLLEFKEEKTEEEKKITEDELKQIEEYNKNSKLTAEGLLKDLKNNRTIEDIKKENEGSEVIAVDTEGVWTPENILGEELLAEINKTEKTNTVNYIQEQPWSNEIYIFEDKREEKEEVEASHILICYKDALRCDKEYTKDEAMTKIKEIQTEVTTENFTDLAKENSTEPNADTKGGYLGFMGKDQYVKPFEEAAFALKDGEISDIITTDFGYHLIYRKSSRIMPEYLLKKIATRKETEEAYLAQNSAWKYTGLTGTQLEKSQLQINPQTNDVMVALTFDSEGKDLFKALTERNIGKPIAIFLDGEIISAPKVSEAIIDGSAVIKGDFSLQEAKTLSQRLNAGALPVPITLLGQQTVGASLGQESIQKSLFAGLIGLLLVCIYMLFMYRLPGFTAILALLFYGILTLTIFKVINVTLTLAGIAGFILSIGMAVDANVLIFERMKEELKEGKPLGTAIGFGFKRAWPSIRDGNLSTIITCVILAWFGTSIIKGFALTLLIGVCISMFSAITVTKALLIFFSKNEKIKNIKSLF